MTARPLVPESQGRPSSAAVALVLVLAMAMVAGCILQGPDDPDSVNHLKIITSTQNITSFVANNSGLKDELDSYAIHNSTEFPVSSDIKKYDIIRVDTKSLKEQLKTGKEIIVSLRGKEYPLKLSQVPSIIAVDPKEDTGIESYHGSLKGVDSDVMLSVSEKYLSGSVSLGGEKYWIDFVSVKKGSKFNEKLIESPLHIIYNTNDVTYPNTPIENPRTYSFAELEILGKLERSSTRSVNLASDTNTTVSSNREVNDTPINNS